MEAISKMKNELFKILNDVNEEDESECPEAKKIKLSNVPSNNAQHTSFEDLSIYGNEERNELDQEKEIPLGEDF